MVWLYQLFKHSHLKGYLNCLQLLATTNKAAITVCTGFSVNVSFHFFEIKYKHCIVWELHI